MHRINPTTPSGKRLRIGRALTSVLVLVGLSIDAAQGQSVTIDFGDNRSSWANDGECDDPRFQGKGMATLLQEQDTLRDANDCRQLFLSGAIRLTAGENTDGTDDGISLDGINFGNNSSDWARDGECDDPRFEGTGMAEFLMDEDQYHDADDCLSLYQSGSITPLNPKGTE